MESKNRPDSSWVKNTSLVSITNYFCKATNVLYYSHCQNHILNATYFNILGSETSLHREESSEVSCGKLISAAAGRVWDVFYQLKKEVSYLTKAL